jgi:hypothetical protein
MKKDERIFAVISVIAGLITLIVFIWFSIKYPNEKVVGERFVKDEIPILPIFGFYFKPITTIVISAFVFWMCTLEYLRKYLMNLPILIKRLIFISFWLIIFVFGYEVIWNFLMWTSLHIINPTSPLDFLYNKLNPSMSHPINFVYATKRDSLYVAIGTYSIYFFSQIMKGKESSA